MLFTGVAPLSTEIADNPVSDAERIVDGILKRNADGVSEADVQSWINGALTQGAGTASEWYVIALSQYGAYDFSAYEGALRTYLAEHTVSSASSRQKYALALLASGSESDYITQVTDQTIGKQGIMSWVYGLHLLNNDCVSEAYSADEVIDRILSLQCEDGGWSTTGAYGDVDVTAMVLQALAPHDAEPAVGASVDKALEMLASRQQASGDFASYGVNNSASTAQVIVALSALGIDAANDERFIKNGRTLLDVIADYRLPDGSFCHPKGGATNETATAQVFYAMIAYIRMASGKGSLYLFDKAPNEIAPPTAAPPTDYDADRVTDPTDVQADQTTDTAQGDRDQRSYKPWVYLIVVGIGAVLCLVLFLTGKRNYKNFIAVILVVAGAIGIVWVTDFSSADAYYNAEDVPKEDAVGKVTMTIRCDTVAGKSESDYIPSDGIILETTEFEIREGDTVYDLLIEAARKYNLQIENNGSTEMAYIVGINYLYEFDFGDLSGWVFHVNGASTSVGCGEYLLSDGDTVEWHYTCALGNDIE